MAAALASADNRTQAALARLEALENDNAGIETVEINDDDGEASLDDDDDEGYMQKRHSKGTKRKTRQAKALEDARKAPRSFLELLHELWGLQVKLLAVISAPFVVFLPTTPVSSVECASVAFVARIFMMTLVASNSLLEQSETSASDVNLYKVESKLEGFLF
ncbi:hypothetical protein CUMW_031540 [Citrus unshiu]|nr:hypothetical protein CUMW_031540 [Citrus unshiu]